MVSNLFLINDPTDLDVIDVKQLNSSDSKVFSFNLRVHKSLQKKGIEHEIAENHLSEGDHLKIFDAAVGFREWYKNKPILKDMEYENVNLLSLLDTNEFQSYLIPVLLNFLLIKKIIEKEKPSKIITTSNFSNIVRSSVDGTSIESEIHSSNLSRNMQWDKIPVKFNIGRFPISLKISKKKYEKIKDFFEQIICSALGLWADLKKNGKTVLLVEFNPALFSDLLFQFSKFDRNVILLNRRRSAVWNLDSIHALRNSKCKLLNFKKILEVDEKNQIPKLHNVYIKKLEKIWSEDDFFTHLFCYEGNSFWPIIKEDLKNTYKKRLLDYIVLITNLKRLFETVDTSCILSLNEIGETEKAILNLNKKEIPSILLEHGFTNFVSETSRFDVVSSYPNFKDRIAVWSNTQKKYLIEQHQIDPNRILVTGSPRHDMFFKKKVTRNIRKQKTVLIAPNPTNEVQGQADTNLHIKVEKIIRDIHSIIKKIPDVNVIVKLHPIQLQHNDDLKSLFQEIDPTIPVYLWTSVIDVVNSCDAVLVISSEGFGTSTMILESLILEKPTINVVVDGRLYDFAHVKEKAILMISDGNDLQENLQAVLFNEELREQLVKNGRKFVEGFLANGGMASEYLAQTLCSTYGDLNRSQNNENAD